MDRKSQAVRPQDAASLVVVRYDTREPRILMGRRQTKTAFMPGVYVFPGGKVEREDSRVRAASALPLDPHAIRQMAVANNASRARALAMAAVRELFEESGLMLGQPGDIGSVISPSWRAFKQAGLAPELKRLHYIARAITPAWSPIRFHARFFMADAAYVTGCVASDGELEDLRWAPLSQANELPIAEVTTFVLNEVRRLTSAAPEESCKRALFTYRNGPCVRYR